jgi:hypothetical protein
VLDEYGYGQRNSRCLIKINVVKLKKLWRKLWGPSQSDIGKRLQKARERQAEFEMWFSDPTGEKKK